MRKPLFVLLTCLAVQASAQSWPARPLRYIVPFPPGAFNDTLARTLAAELPKSLGQPVIVENRPGGNTIVLPHARAGKLKALAVSSKTCTPLAPEIPTVDESGVPGYDVSVWFGVLTVAGTPRDIVQRLNTEMVKILASPEIRERFGKTGVEVVAGTPEQFSQFLKSEVARWAQVVRDAGIKAD